jgi:hypothetical protein
MNEKAHPFTPPWLWEIRIVELALKKLWKRGASSVTDLALGSSMQNIENKESGRSTLFVSEFQGESLELRDGGLRRMDRAFSARSKNSRFWASLENRRGAVR